MTLRSVQTNLKNIKLLIGFQVFQGSKLIILELSGRRFGGFLGSSLPNHDAKGWKVKTEIEIKKKPRVDYIREG